MEIIHEEMVQGIVVHFVIDGRTDREFRMKIKLYDSTSGCAYRRLTIGEALSSEALHIYTGALMDELLPACGIEVIDWMKDYIERKASDLTTQWRMQVRTRRAVMTIEEKLRNDSFWSVPSIRTHQLVSA